MYQLQDKGINEIEIKKSKFITYGFVIKDTNKIKEIIDDIRIQHPEARHVCSAFKIGDNSGYDDDGEPSKTAGFPMLEVIRLKEVDNILVVCVRYFGGIKLGSGGLIRAYANSCSELINTIGIAGLISAYNLEIRAHIRFTDKIRHLISCYHTNIISERITNEYYVNVEIVSEKSEEFRAQLINLDHEIQINELGKTTIIDKL